VLVPAPDYPLWTAAVALSGGSPVHYRCDEGADWFPDLDDIRRKITPRVKGIVVINPNNPTGAVYSRELLQGIIEIARQHQLIIFADEIYDKILYDEAKHVPLASLAEDVLMVTFNGLSKTYRLAGFRSGWMTISGDKSGALDYIKGLDVLSNMRLCANVPGQHAIQTALGGYQSINELIAPGGRLHAQRQAAYGALTAIEGITCARPLGALYLFPRLDPKVYRIEDDEKLVLEFLKAEAILLVKGSGFNISDTQHLRIVFLPHAEVLVDAIERFARFLQRYRA
jgi:alanine-synthesizing transaminase